MLTGMFHLHKAAVIIFLLIYLLKLIGLLAGSQAMRNFFARKGMRITEMVISVLFLATGVYLFMQLPPERIDTLLIVKITLVLLSIPIAVIGFKRGNKGLAILSVLFLFGAYGMAEMHKKNPGVTGEDVHAASSGVDMFKAANCATCHGMDGKARIAGAKDLTKSVMTDEQILVLLDKGRNMMPSYKRLSAAEKKLLIDYVHTLHAQP